MPMFPLVFLLSISDQCFFNWGWAELVRFSPSLQAFTTFIGAFAFPFICAEASAEQSAAGISLAICFFDNIHLILVHCILFCFTRFLHYHVFALAWFMHLIFFAIYFFMRYLLNWCTRILCYIFLHWLLFFALSFPLF